MKKLGLVWGIAAAVIGSGFQHGYNVCTLNLPQSHVFEWMKEVTGVKERKMSYLLFAMTFTLFSLGGMIGGGLIGVMSNRFGRRGSLLINNVLVFIAAAFMFSSKYFKSVHLLIIGRLFIGINVGINSGMAPIYLSEIAPLKIRGTIVSLYQLVYSTMLLLAQCLGMKFLLGNENLWHYLLLLIIVGAIYQTAALLFAGESPKYILFIKRDENLMLSTLERLYKKEETRLKMEEEVRQDVEESLFVPKITFKDMFKRKELRKPLFLICVLMLLQQLAGFEAFVTFASFIFRSQVRVQAQYLTVGIGFVSVLATCVCVVYVDRLGRKPLLLISFIGMTFFMVCTFISSFFVKRYPFVSYISVLLLYAYTFSYGVGAGTIPWILAPEWFNTAARPMAVTVSSVARWFFNLCIVFIFPIMLVRLGTAVILIFVINQTVSFFIVFIFVPETKGLPPYKVLNLFDI